MTKLKLSRANGTYAKLIDKIFNQHLLILDDFGLYPLEQPSLDLMGVIEDRYGKNATIMVSQCLYGNGMMHYWKSLLQMQIMDGVVHTSHRIER